LFITSTTPSTISTLSLHDALPISLAAMTEMKIIAHDDMSDAEVPHEYPRDELVGLHCGQMGIESECGNEIGAECRRDSCLEGERSEEHTSELQSRFDLVCRLLLEK